MASRSKRVILILVLVTLFFCVNYYRYSGKSDSMDMWQVLAFTSLVLMTLVPFIINGTSSFWIVDIAKGDGDIFIYFLVGCGCFILSQLLYQAAIILIE